MRGVAAAYQSKDVAFFREHWAQFNEQMANAIRTSPSVRVDFDVKRIDVRDDHHATVHVRRTDTFPQAAMPPGGAESRVRANPRRHNLEDQFDRAGAEKHSSAARSSFPASSDLGD